MRVARQRKSHQDNAAKKCIPLMVVAHANVSVTAVKIFGAECNQNGRVVSI